MAFRATCPYCGATYAEIPESRLGAEAKCGRCARQFRAQPMTTEATAAALEAQERKLRFARVAAMVHDQDLIRRVPEEVLRKALALPLAIIGREVVVAMDNPSDETRCELLRRHLGPIRPLLALPQEINAALDEAFHPDPAAAAAGAAGAQAGLDPRHAALIAGALAEMESEFDAAIDANPDTVMRARARTEGTPARQALDRACEQALRAGATEVRLLPAPDGSPMLQARAEAGVAQLTLDPACSYADVLTCLKIDGGLNLHLTDSEQTGTIPFRWPGGEVEMLVRLLPARGTEVAQIRLIDAAAMRQRRALERRSAIDGQLSTISAADWPPESLGIQRGRARNVVADNLGQQLAAVRLAVSLLAQAIDLGATDIVFDPHQGGLRLLWRHTAATDAEPGHFHELTTIPPAGVKPLIARLMLTAGLDLADDAHAQQGLFHVVYGANSYELRLATLPTPEGPIVMAHIPQLVGA